MEDISGKYLLERLSEGRKDAYSELFDKYYLKVKRFVRTVSYGSLDADDIAQNVFLKVWEHRSKLASVQSLDAYLFTVTRNEVCDSLRKHQVKRKFEEAAINEESIVEGLRINYDTDEIARIVGECVSNMPPQRQMCFRLSREQFLTSQKIAEQLNISKRTVDRHLSLALKDIREALGKVLSGVVLFIVTCWL